MKSSLERLNSIFELAEERISELKNGSIESIQSEEQDEKRTKKNRQNMRPVAHHKAYQHTGNRIPEGEKKKWHKEYLKK